MKSHEKNLLTLGLHILKDAAAKCSVDNRNVSLDFKTIKSRVKHEGISFLTISLPDFGKQFERALANQQVSLTSFPGWKRCKGLPSFMKGFLSLVFDVTTGALLDEESIPAIEGVRQIAYAFKKLGLPCSSERTYRALRSFVEVEHVLPTSMFNRHSDLFGQTCRLLWGDVFLDHFDPETVTPKHGPGQTADRKSVV